MKRRNHPCSRKLSLLCGMLLLLEPLMAEPTPAATAAFNVYAKSLELRLVEQHRSAVRFLAPADPDPAAARRRLLRGEVLLQQLTPANLDLPGALLHHWRGTAFVPGAHAEDFERLMQNFSGYPQFFSPQVLQARVLQRDGDHFQAWMRVRQHHAITVVMDTAYDVTFGELDAKHGYSISRSTRIDEIADAGDRSEHALAPSSEHGFLWRLNTYWSYEERDGGLYLQIETVSLTRSIPRGLGWAIAPYVESIPRESLEFTLISGRNAIERQSRHHTLKGRTMSIPALTTKAAAFTPARRVNHSLTASLEKRALQWMAQRAPRWLTSDHLTILGFAAQVAAGLAYAASRYDHRALLLVIFCLALNWFGDSMDGTLARVRCKQRPRFGFYVDHMADAFGAVALMAGLGASGFVHWSIAYAMLVTFLLLSCESFLATYTLSCFQLSQGYFGPTEIRILLAIGNLALLRSPFATLFGHKLLLFDLGGVIATIFMFSTAIVLTLRHTAQLYREEPLA